jgi:hypothetical protein
MKIRPANVVAVLSAFDQDASALKQASMTSIDSKLKR